MTRSIKTLRAEAVPHLPFLRIGIIDDTALRIDQHCGSLLGCIRCPIRLTFCSGMTGPCERSPHFAHIVGCLLAIRISPGDHIQSRSLGSHRRVEVVELVRNFERMRCSDNVVRSRNDIVRRMRKDVTHRREFHAGRALRSPIVIAPSHAKDALLIAMYSSLGDASGRIH